MITEDYVSFKVAKLLKEKGFDGICGTAYETITNEHKAEQSSISEWGKLGQVKRPTLQMAMKWLREKNLVICIIPLTFYGGEKASWWGYNIWADDNLEIDEEDTPKFATYEEASESAIKYCLKNFDLSMTDKEKTRAYDEVLDRCKKWVSGTWGHSVDDTPKDVAEFIFPQLAESEDEKMRKELIDFVNHYRHNTDLTSEQALWCKKALAWLEKQKEQKPVEMEVYEVGKGTTICGQDYKCKKDFKEGNCWYIKDAIYHCGRDGYLTDQNGVSWSCTPEWFNEYIQSNREWAEEEKTRFVSGQFLQCKLSFDGFKGGEHYWLEYIGDDMYVGRSDNILNQKFHITPRQLYTLFSQQLDEKQKEQKPTECSAKGRRGRIGSTPEHIRKKAENFLSKMEPPYDADDICSAYETGAMESIKQEWSEEDEEHLKSIISTIEMCMKDCEDANAVLGYYDSDISWLKSLPERFSLQPKQEWSEEDEKMLKGALYCAGYTFGNTHPLVAWLKSLRNRVGKESLQPHWKPSEEQMKAVKHAYNSFPNDCSTKSNLKLLYHDLEKLM